MLTKSLLQLRDAARKFANKQGQTSLLRHPDDDVNDYINRALGSLHRHLTEAVPDQAALASSIVTMTPSVAVYALPSNFDHLISIDLLADGVRKWLVGYEMHERARLVDPSQSFEGVPCTYRLRGTNIEYLPIPKGVYTSTLWYVPAATQLANDATTYDTISRLDDYVIAYAARFIATKNRDWDLVAECRAVCTELQTEISSLARSRDRNSPARIVDETYANRWGRRRRWA